MQFVLDVHCHTVASGHAFSTITENAAFAAENGITHIGICDHAPKMPGGAHLYHFANQKILPEYIHGVRVYRGAECNILDTEGTLDLPRELLEAMDFVIAALHRVTVAPTNAQEHTRATVNAMERNKEMHILAHPGDVFFPFDIEEVVRTAARTHTVIEINNQSLVPNSFRYHGDATMREIIAKCKEHGVSILASSDAHYHAQIGQYHLATALIKDANYPPELVLNTSPALFEAAIERKRREWTI